MIPAQTFLDRFDDFNDFVFVSLLTPVEFLECLDQLALRGVFIERRSPITYIACRRGDLDRPRFIHHIDYSTDFGFEWVKVMKRLDAMGLNRPDTLILNIIGDELPDFQIEPSVFEYLAPGL